MLVFTIGDILTIFGVAFAAVIYGVFWFALRRKR